MKITKYKHSCLLITKNNQSVVIDPGSFSTDFTAPNGVVATVITDAHGDHLNVELIKAIVDTNPDVRILGHPDAMKLLQGMNTTAVTSGETASVGNFQFSFFGGQHALIHPSIPEAINLGVLIDDTFYYPGDSFTVPNVEINVLALPVSGPWISMNDTINFLLAIHPRLAFPTHDIFLSSEGEQLTDRLLGEIAEANHIVYRRAAEPIMTEE